MKLTINPICIWMLLMQLLLDLKLPQDTPYGFMLVLVHTWHPSWMSFFKPLDLWPMHWVQKSGGFAGIKHLTSARIKVWGQWKNEASGANIAQSMTTPMLHSGVFADLLTTTNIKWMAGQLLGVPSTKALSNR